MGVLLFATHFPVFISTNIRSGTSARPASLNCCDKSLPSNQPEDPQWINLARSIGPSDEKETGLPSRPPPQWTYPDGDPTQFTDDLNPWHSWNSSQAVEQNSLAERDPKAETDFWRSTARDIVQPPTPGSPTVPAPIPDQELLPQNMTSSEQVWKMARGITGDMTDFQNQLLDDLNSYDSDEKREQYREIAREIVGPSNDEPWEDQEPVPPNDRTDVGAGWNPDVDWMRFDDVRRDQVLAEEAAQRRSVENAARQSMRSALDSEREDSSQSVNEVSPDIGTSSGYSAEYQPTSSDFSVDGKVPGFIKNRFRSSGTYGSSWSGIDEESERLQSQGFQLRDPRIDTESWMSAAKEVTSELKTSLRCESNDESNEEASFVENKGLSMTDSKDSESEVSGSTEETSDTPSTDEDGKLWTSWIQSSIDWNQANKKIEERDTKKEVDMWRVSARELTNDESISNSAEDAEISVGAGSDSGAWEEWRRANEKWGDDVTSGNTEGTASPFQDMVTDQDDSKIDWGAGLGKTNSERGAWENWNRVAVGQVAEDSRMWWSNRVDDSSQKGSNSDSDEPLMNVEDVVNGKKSERIKNNQSLDEWRSFAKELGGGEPN